MDRRNVYEWVQRLVQACNAPYHNRAKAAHRTAELAVNNWLRVPGPTVETEPGRIRILQILSVWQDTSGDILFHLDGHPGKPQSIFPHLDRLPTLVDVAAAWRIHHTYHAALVDALGSRPDQQPVPQLYSDPYLDRLALAGWRECTHRAASEAILALVNPEVERLARDLGATERSRRVYMTAYRHRDLLRQVQQESPGLAPVAFAALVHNLVPATVNILQGLKGLARARGLAPAHWRAVAHLPPAVVKHFIKAQGGPVTAGLVEQLLDLGRWLVHLDGPPTLELFRRWLREPALPPAWFARAALLQARAEKKRGRYKEWLREEYDVAVDWLRFARPNRPDTNQQRAGWIWIRRQSEAWHTAGHVLQPDDSGEWISALSTYPEGEYVVVPLTTARALQEEGSRMHHCVANYASQCLGNRSRIFSVRSRDGKKILATVEICRLNTGVWVLGQVRGPCNAAVSPRLRKVAQLVAERYTTAAPPSRIRTPAREGAGNPRASHRDLTTAGLEKPPRDPCLPRHTAPARSPVRAPAVVNESGAPHRDRATDPNGKSVLDPSLPPHVAREILALRLLGGRH